MPRDPLLDQSMDQGGPQIPFLKAGQRLFNRRYELKQFLGAGGMGVVWLARDHTEEIEVALKVLPSVLVLQEREMQRLREEVRAGKELRHPRLVATYGMEVEDSIAAIVMEYVSGQTLKEKLEAQERGFFEPEEIDRWVRDICEALDYLHSKAKRIHRDLKPANIIVDASGEARLTDFGISHRIQEGVSRHSKTSDREASGSSSTLAYASPQQISGKPSHPSDDIYSLGATIYELLTGTPPFYRGAMDVVGFQIATQPVTPVMERRAELVTEGANASTGQDVAENIEAILLTCLAKDREKRPANAGKIVEGLAAKPQQSSPLTPLSGTQAGKLPDSTHSPQSPRDTPSHSQSHSPPMPLRGQPSPLDRRSQSGRHSGLWRVLGGLLVVVVAAWGWKTFFPPDDRFDKLPTSQEALEKAATEQVQKEQAEEENKTKADAGRAAGPPAAASVSTSTNPPKTTALGGPSALLPATATKDAPFVNSLGMKFVPVPIGAGDSKGQRVLFSIWETRSKDYAAFMHSGSYRMYDTDADDWKTFDKDGVSVGRGAGESAEDSSHPVANVSHDDAVGFCAWLTKQDRATGLIGPKDEYRLPTDTEWSYAVGIGDKEEASASPKDKSMQVKDVYPWGSTFPPSARSGNYADEDAKAKGVITIGMIEGYHDGYATTAPVGSYTPNGLGIYDLGGNFWEWTSSPYEPGSDRRVLRGASWYDYDASFTLSSYRVNVETGIRHYDIGFRCVLVVGGDMTPPSTSQTPAPSPPPPVTKPVMPKTPKTDSPTAASVPKSTNASTPPVALGGPSALPAPVTKDSPFTNSLGMRFVPVPIGAGPSAGQRVLFAVWETRSKDYAAFMKSGSYTMSGHDAGEDWRTAEMNVVPVGRGERETAEISNHPVVYVSWEDATAFAQWLTRQERDAGRIGPRDEYRLPTDVEWSYAVGIGDRESADASPRQKSGLADLFHWGGDYPPTDPAGNYAASTTKMPNGILVYMDGYATTAPVGSFAANRYGLHDLDGNVAEWCQDWYDDNQDVRVQRGGSWNADASVSMHSRSSGGPRYRYIITGFRCVLAVAGG